MRIPDVIAAKRDGRELAPEDIGELVLGYARGDVPDYQMSAFLMAVCLKGMTFAETSAMTAAMVSSGASLDLSSIAGIKVDKHSTGGVGDKTTLVVVPILAACGLKVPKMSGRGLGHTGGTMDKLESIPGFRTGLSMDEFVRQVAEIGAAMAGQSPDIVPADKKIYALRDVTGTVECIPLIAASVMSKKTACSSDVILLDVKSGSGAFMPDIASARELAQTMIAIGKDLGRRVGAVITDMNQPLGSAVGNALEVREAVQTLRGGGPERLRDLCVELAGKMLYMTGLDPSPEAGRTRVSETLGSGAALEKFREIVRAQGGDDRVLDDPGALPQARGTADILSRHSGIVSQIDCAGIGSAASLLGAGRVRKEDEIDPAVGIVVHRHLGDSVEKGQPLATIHWNREESVRPAEDLVLRSYDIGDSGEAPPLVYEALA